MSQMSQPIAGLQVPDLQGIEGNMVRWQTATEIPTLLLENAPV